MLRRLDLRGAGTDLRDRLPRPEAAGEGPVAAVQAIIADVRARGDEALLDLTERFDGVRPDPLRVPPEACRAALDRLAPPLRTALEVALGNITAYHETQLGEEGVHRRGGIEVRDLHRPVDRAGLYVPGGLASYPSTVLMTAVPARVAGVPELALCVPPRRDGSVADEVLGAAALAGVDEVFRVGGAQAIAAMAHGTASIRPVDVIVGPGNVYVAVAKRALAGVVGIPSAFAGPSEVVVIADGTTPADLAAVDLVVQAEHGPDGLAWLVTWSEAAADAVAAAVAGIVANSPRRAMIESTLDQGGYAVLVDGPEQAMAVANLIAPEH
ncbi:MAG: histidinol dehydrogenase, partial [Acidimicrobiia bacterium]